jgi:uncharacterized membrane protein YbaN (DUF454 family)
MARFLRHIAGWGLLLLGVVGLVLPVLQGWLLIAIGALLLAPDVPVFARLVCWVETRFPPVRGVLRSVRRKLGHGAAPPCGPEDRD